MTTDTTDVTSGADPIAERRKAIAALEAQLTRTPKGRDPYAHAAVAYRLGLAYAESPVGQLADNLRRALGLYDEAAKIFDPRHDPVEHARVLNAAGAAHRGLGQAGQAARLFDQAAALLEGRDRDGERAAALNNLGLVRTDLGETAAAVAAFTAAYGLFDPSTEDGFRGRLATLVNRGLAQAAAGTAAAGPPSATGGAEAQVASLEAAVADYREALEGLEAAEAPYHWALAQHSLGVALLELAGFRPGDRARLVAESRAALAASLTVFTRAAFPFQYGLAKHNLGLAHLAAGEAAGDTTALRRALACIEDSVSVLDPRQQEPAFRRAYASLTRVEEALARLAPESQSRPDHFAALLAGCEPDERAALLRERILLLLALPEHRRHAGLVEAAAAIARLDYETARRIIEAELTFLAELPNQYLEAALSARMAAHQRIGNDDDRERADRALDQAVSDALNGPQRVFVRDHLYSLGFERP